MPRPSRPARGAPASQIELPGYRDFVLIARSEASEVYRAHQDGLDRPVAVKVLLLDDAEAVARFEREIGITVQLGRQHPHIVTVIDTGTTGNGRPCIVMEHYDGGSLYDRLRAHGPMAWGDVLAAGAVVADALSFAHRYGVLHRDVKPQNVLVLPTSYVVADFGIARHIDAARTTSVEWFSFQHAAPQVLDGEPPAVADDIWSLGSTLFMLLDGAPPFASGIPAEDTALAYMKRVRTGRPRALHRPDVPAGLLAVIDQCMQSERADRFPDAAALRDALSDLASEARAWAPTGATGSRGVGATGSTGSARATGATGAGRATGDTGSRAATGGVPSRSTGRSAEAPRVVPIQAEVLIPQPAPSLPATAVPPPVEGRPAPPVTGTAAPPGSTGRTAPPVTGWNPPPGTYTARPQGPPAPPAPGFVPASPVAPPTESVPAPAAHDVTMRGQFGAYSPAAMAQLVASAVAAGGYAAGEEVAAEGATSNRYTEAPPVVTTGPIPVQRLRRIVVGAAVALLVGGVLGIGGTWVAGSGREAPAGSAPRATAPGGSAGPSAAAGAPTPSGARSTQSPIANQAIAPAITQIQATRTSVLLRWRDNSGGKATFVVYRAFVNEVASPPLEPGTTSFRVDGLDPATGQYCFFVLAFMSGANGIESGRSDQRCAPAG
jgi:hypothetical protein